jgi:hypothetical protein
VPKETYERATLLRALEEIGAGDGEGLSLQDLGIDFGGEPQTNGGDGIDGSPRDAVEAEEVPEVDTPLDGE